MAKLIVGNWKMNGLRADLEEIRVMVDGKVDGVDMAICPPATLLREAAALGLPVGGQDCHAKDGGAHTGDLSASMLKDAGARYVIVGHSERRANHGETDALVRSKADAALAAGLVPIICVGETEAERAEGRTLDVLRRQVEGSTPKDDRVVIAYEPVWAIGTGRVAAAGDVREAHRHIREVASGMGIADVRVLYGGSMKPGNAGELLAMDEVGGGLVGGASLKASDFLAICRAAPG